ncbi:hypothetical protein D3C76_1312290 [compost metagenome]
MVAAWIEMSIPKSSALNSTPAAQVLSIIMMASGALLRTACTMAGTSCTSMVMEPGDSRNTIRVLGWIRSAILAPICGSNQPVVTPSLLRILVQKSWLGS